MGGKDTFIFMWVGGVGAGGGCTSACSTEAEAHIKLFLVTFMDTLLALKIVCGLGTRSLKLC